MRTRLATLLALIGVGFIGTNGNAGASEPVTIRSGFTVMVSGYSPIVLEKKEVLAHYGISYRLEPRHFQSTSLELTALAAGEADIISIGLNWKWDDVFK